MTIGPSTVGARRTPSIAAALAGGLLLALPTGFLPAVLEVPLARLGIRLDNGLLQHDPGGARREQERRLGDGVRAGFDVVAAWNDAARDALQRPLPVTLPLAERLLLRGAPSEPSATAQVFAIEVPPDRVLRIASVAGGGSRGGLMVELLRPDGAATTEASTLFGFGPDPAEHRLAIEVPGRYLVRVQPTLGAIGSFGLAIQTQTLLDFPVDTDAVDPVRSVFGDPRDGGRRQHHGIDIFAARGTAVLAAADGVITRTGDSALGGLHVWQHAVDDRGASLGSLYYAHLDTIEARVGSSVARGTRLGTVGNTGNARSTPPHLHFGLYGHGGPRDPLPLTGPRRQAALRPDSGHGLPEWLAVSVARVNLRAGPGTAHPVLDSVTRGDLLQVLAVTDDGGWIRVRVDEDRQGYVARRLLGAPVPRSWTAMEELDGLSSAGTVDLFAAPSPDAGRLTSVSPASLQVLGRHGLALRVATPEGLVGWLRLPIDART